MSEDSSSASLTPAGGRDTPLIRICLVIVIIGLVVSGVTAFPLREELMLGRDILNSTGLSAVLPDLTAWVQRVAEALETTGTDYPFLAYGTDWLAFGHVVIAVAFIGAWRDPVRNKWLFQFGMIACVAVVPWALVFGAVRGIPLGWRLIDCAFGVVGFFPMWLCWRLANEVEQSSAPR